MSSLGQRLETYKGIAPGFDFLRIFLAVSVVAWHAPAIVLNDMVLDKTPYVWLFGYSVLAAFFGLSGFLIAGSAQRLSLGNFLINRGLRIVPALGVEVCLCLFILGPIFTTFTLSEYFSMPDTWKYLTNILGIINWTLPGVFEDHPSRVVNNTLWTVPHEIGCYVIMSGLMVLGLLRYPKLIIAMAVAIIVIGIGLQFLGLEKESHGVEGKILYTLFISRASRLYVCFLLGIAFYLYRDRIPYSKKWFIVCFGFCLVLGSFTFPDGVNYPLTSLIIAPPLIYMTMYMGVTNIWIPSFLRKGDYSYGIYLYGWPMQQMTVALFPMITNPLMQLFIAVPLITIFAMFSWHFIEKPILRMRKKFSFVARVRLESEEKTVAIAAGVPKPNMPTE